MSTFKKRKYEKICEEVEAMLTAHEFSSLSKLSPYLTSYVTVLYNGSQCLQHGFSVSYQSLSR